MFPLQRTGCERPAVRPDVPSPGAGLAAGTDRRLGNPRLTPAIWPAVTLPGHADRRRAVDGDTLPDLLLALRERGWPLHLAWPTVNGWCQQHLVLSDVQARAGGWLLRWPQGALLLPDALLHQVWQLARQRRHGLEQHLMASDMLGRTSLLVSPATAASTPHCGWQGLLDGLAPRPRGTALSPAG